jgi:hypothetical protein
MHRRNLTQLSTLGFVVSIGSTALAQTTQGALQIGLGTDFVNHTKFSGTWKQPAENIDSERKTTHWGFSTHQNVYIEGGYGIGDSIVVGGFLLLGRDRVGLGRAVGSRRHLARFRSCDATNPMSVGQRAVSRTTRPWQFGQQARLRTRLEISRCSARHHDRQRCPID